MKAISFERIDRAWISGLSYLFNYGNLQNVLIDGKKVPTLEAENMLIEVPGDQTDESIQALLDGPGHNAMMGDYIRQLCWGERISGFDYTYYNREVYASGTYRTIDQRSAVLDRLENDPTSRQAVTTTWDVEDDTYRTPRAKPCKIYDSWRIRQSKLNYTIHFRSWHFFGAAPLNMAGHLFRMWEVADKLDSETMELSLGTFAVFADIPHLYWYDWPRVAELLTEVVNDSVGYYYKGIRGAIGQRLGGLKDATRDRVNWDQNLKEIKRRAIA